MNADLEDTLGELGPAYRDVVARLMSARELEPCTKHGAWRPATTFLWRFGYVAAASVAVALGVSVLMRGAANAPRAQFPSPTAYTAAYVSTDEALEAIVTTQRADGSWKNDFLTKRNSTALTSCATADARIAYKKAMRTLRLRGVL